MATSSAAHAIDFRFDVAPASFVADNTTWFTAAHLPALAFPSVNGHDIEMTDWNNTYNNTITNVGNTFSIYYNDYHKRFPAGESAATSVSKIDAFAKDRFGADANSRWLVLNEIDAATWNGANGGTYRSWVVDTLKGLKNLGYEKIILWSPRYLASKTHQSTFQSISQYAYIGLETYLDGRTIKNNNFNLATTQAYYQGYYNSWTSVSNGAGVPAAKIFAGEHFSVNDYDPTHYWGANGISGADWQRAIQIRSLAIHNIPFGGFIGYLWNRNDQATGDDATDLATQQSYMRAYAATMVVQTEVPTWTGNSGATISWSDGFNWTGGRPSTTQHPYPLLAASNPNLPKQTTANLFKTIRANTTITLDGNQSVTRLAFDSPYVYTIATGTHGSLTLTGSNASLAVISGSHAITAGLVVASNVAGSFAGNLSVSGPLTVNAGLTLTKSGVGTLTLSGQQNWAANSQLTVTGGEVVFASNAGPTSRNLLLNVQPGAEVTFRSPQNLAAVQIGASATVAVAPGGANTVTADALVIDAANRGALDVADNALLVKNMSGLAVRNLLVSGFAAGAWNGGGINSSTAAADFATGDKLLALGYVDVAQLPAGTTSFAGITGLDANDVIVKPALYGDADLGGTVDLDDFGQLLAGLEGDGAGWLYGDFDYNGSVDLDDFGQFLAGYDLGGAPLSEMAQLVMTADLTRAVETAMLSAIVAVPEPTGTAVLATAACGFAVRRRRR